MNLYDIDLQLAELLMRQAEGEDITQELDALKLAKNEKLTACWYALRNLEAETTAYEREMERLKAKRDSLRASYEWLKSWVANSLGDGNKFENGVAKFGWRKSEAVETDNLEATVDAYRRYKWEPAKDLIKADLKQGASIPGWRLVSRNNLQVK